MVTKEEQESLTNLYLGKPADAALVLKCAAGLSIIALVAAVSIGQAPDVGGVVGRSANAQSAPPVSRSMAAMQEAMAERRERFQYAHASARTPGVRWVTQAQASNEPSPGIDEITLLRRTSD